MKIIVFAKLMLVLTLSVLLFACGGGGGGSQGKVVNGVARAGVFTKGQVAFDGYSGAQLNKPYSLVPFTNFTSPTGAFAINVGNYNGPLLIKTVGSYTDEATGKKITVTSANPLRALLAQGQVSNGVTVPVTPLTDIAANKTLSAGISDTAIIRNNQGVAQLFGFADVTKTIPVIPTVASLGTSTATPEVTYAVALVKLSNYVAEYAAAGSGTTSATVPAAQIAAALPVALAQLGNGVTVSGTSTATTVSISAEVKATLQALISEPVVVGNTTVTVPAATITALNTAVTTASSTLIVKNFTLKVTGSAAPSVYGFQVQIPVPNGITITADSTGVVPVTAVVPAAGLPVVATLRNGVLTVTYAGGVAQLTDGATFATVISSVTDSNLTLGTPTSVIAYDRNTQTVNGIGVTIP